VGRSAAVGRSAPVAAAKAAAATKSVVAAPAAKPAATPPVRPKKVVLDKFMLEQRDLLKEQLASHVNQAESLKEEADALAREMEPGESEFGEEGGEGGTLSVERELDLVLSAQAKAAVEEIERALHKIESGTYGVCEKCGRDIPRARLKALPNAPLCVSCKSGGLSRR
jgi:DnaK suppressor protein